MPPAEARPRFLPPQVHYLLKNIYRDWSVEGAAERAESYGPIVAEVCRLFGPDRRAPATDQPATILCPGCGLGECLRLQMPILKRSFLPRPAHRAHVPRSPAGHA